MTRARVLLGDDQEFILEALKAVLSENFEVVGVAWDGEKLIEEAKRLQPDAVVLDIAMPVLNGFEAARQIKEANPNVKLVFLTQTADQAYVDAAFETGASAYVLKQAAGTELVNALREVLAGKDYRSPRLSRAAGRAH